MHKLKNIIKVGSKKKGNWVSNLFNKVFKTEKLNTMNKLPEYDSLEEKMQFFAKGTEELPWIINTQNEFDEFYDFIIKKHNEDFKNGCNYLYYRGVNEAKYQTFTSAQRHWLLTEWEDNSRHGFVEYIDTELYNIRRNSLLTNYYRSLGVHPNDLLFLAFLQHYGASSPLLDLTHNPDIGLFFAFDKMTNCISKKKEINNYVSLQILDFSNYSLMHFTNMVDILESGISKAHEMINEWKKNNPGQDIDDSLIRDIAKLTAWYNSSNPGGSLSDLSIALLDFNKNKIVIDTTGRPLYWSNLRLIAQKGAFLFYPNHEKPLEKYLKDIKAPLLRCININKNLKEYVGKKINKDHASIYPLEEDIVKDANSRAKLALQRKNKQ